VEAVILAVLLVVLAVAGPVGAVGVGRSAYQAAARAEQAARADWHQVTAVLLADADHPVPLGFGNLGLVPMSARWTGPDGSQRHGKVAAMPGTRAGSKVTTWVDAAGRPAGPPLAGGRVAVQGWLAGIATGAGVLLLLSCAWLLARRWLDRRRLAAWEAALRSAPRR
jgi:hypothetical protein